MPLKDSIYPSKGWKWDSWKDYILKFIKKN